MDIKKITMKLGNLDQPVITDYELGLIIFDSYSGTKNECSYDDYVKQLVDLGIIVPNREFQSGSVFNITGKKGYSSGDVSCSIDPFAYVSHMSAMSFHGLTDRIPNSLNISTPPCRNWRLFALERMKRDLGGNADKYKKLGMPNLKMIKMDKINGQPVIEYKSVHQGAFKKIENKKIRVATIGRTFLDTVRKPDYCGGMAHVIDVFEEYGASHKRAIIDTADKHGRSIEKSRIGYLLEEICEVSDPVINKWAEHVARGGSRKLDPNNEYSPEYSERWCLSLNVY